MKSMDPDNESLKLIHFCGTVMGSLVFVFAQQMINIAAKPNEC